MTTQPTSTTANRVLVVGALDSQQRRGKRLTVVEARNELRGREEQIALQVPSPFGKSYALPIHLDGPIPGSDLLEVAAEGVLLAAVGRLEWEQRIDHRYAVEAGDRGRRSNELTFHVSEIRLPATDEEPGCDVWIEGIVLTPARIMRHVYKPSVRLAMTTLQITVERQRKGSRARIHETERVPVVIPLDHADAPKLLRPRNRVIVEGMLERIIVDMRGPDVDRAVAAIDEAWQQQRAELQGAPEQLRAAEQQHTRERARLTEAPRSRVVAGYIELLDGEPATIAESQKLREAFLQRLQKRTDD